jgi:hypothetical protein
MEQRRVRLGDIVDDYCPRERRITNHAVVAMIEDDIRLTRCTTCDAEHPFKNAQVPRRRKKDAPAAAYDQVLAGRLEAGAALTAAGHPGTEPPDEATNEMTMIEGAPVNESEPVDESEPVEDRDLPPAPARAGEDGPVHRPLIRATLPRPEGQPVERRAPDFTIRQSGGRNGGFRDGDSRAARGGRPAGGGKPFHAGPPGRMSGRPGRGHTPGAGRFERPSPHGRHNRPGPPRHGKKRSR